MEYLKYPLLLAVGLLLVAGAVLYVYRDTLFGPKDFASCFAKYGLAPKVFPQTCKTPSGQAFERPLPPESTPTELGLFTDLTTPVPSPFTLEFAALRSWAVDPFLLELKIGDEIVASTTAVEDSTLSSDTYVHLQGSFLFTAPAPGTAAVLLFNVYGMPVEIPITLQ